MLSHERPRAAENIAIQVCVLLKELREINMEIKEMQREIYFMGLEISRKKLIARKLNDEMSKAKLQLAFLNKLVDTAGFRVKVHHLASVEES